MKIQSKILANKLEDWIYYTNKVENDSVSEAVKILRGFIEREEKIQKEIQLDYVHVTVSYKTLNFLTPAPIILPAKEERFENRFTVSQLYQLIQELKGLSSLNFMLESKALLQYFSRKSSNGVSEFSLPNEWINHGLKQYQNMIQNLDEESLGMINGKAFCTFLCLLKTPIMSQEEKLQYSERLKSYNKVTIGMNEFINVECWFDEFERGKMEESKNKLLFYSFFVFLL